jgi:hypothetical protein
LTRVGHFSTLKDIIPKKDDVEIFKKYIKHLKICIHERDYFFLLWQLPLMDIFHFLAVINIFSFSFYKISGKNKYFNTGTKIKIRLGMFCFCLKIIETIVTHSELLHYWHMFCFDKSNNIVYTTAMICLFYYKTKMSLRLVTQECDWNLSMVPHL